METGPILRVFEVRPKDGFAELLQSNFSTVSADVVKGKPGNRGYFFGRSVQGSEDTLMFVSVWESLTSIKDRFGEDWEKSFIPEGYEEMIEECSVRHFDVADGWHVGEF